MIVTGIFTMAFGMAYFFNIHYLGFFIGMQVNDNCLLTTLVVISGIPKSSVLMTLLLKSCSNDCVLMTASY